MSVSAGQWFEVVFDVSYLVVIYALVVSMSLRLAHAADPQYVLRRFRDGFLLLALGDTGHVGLRAYALLTGGLDARVTVLGASVHLVGLGALATAITVTLLYLALLDAWRVWFDAKRSAAFFTLVAVGLLRLALLVPAANRWGDAMPPWGWSVLRNAPLLVLGIGVAVLFIRDGRRTHDATFQQLGWLIVGSYALYLPVILFVQAVPALGLLMVPKTVVYLAMAALAYVRLFKPHDADHSPTLRLNPGH